MQLIFGATWTFSITPSISLVSPKEHLVIDGVGAPGYHCSLSSHEYFVLHRDEQSRLTQFECRCCRMFSKEKSLWTIASALLDLDLGRSSVGSCRSCSAHSYFHQCLGHGECESLRWWTILYGGLSVWLSSGSVRLHSHPTIDAIAEHRLSGGFGRCNRLLHSILPFFPLGSSRHYFLYSQQYRCVNRFHQFHVLDVLWINIRRYPLL